MNEQTVSKPIRSVRQRHTEIPFEAMAGVLRATPKRRLSFLQTARLYRRICDIRGQFDIHRVADSSPAGRPNRRELDPLISAASKLARFGMKAESDRGAARELEFLIALAQEGRTHTQGEQDASAREEVDATIRGFFESAFKINEWLAGARATEWIDGVWDNDISAELWLLGEALPELYELTFGKKFSRSRDKEQNLRSGEALDFIQAVLLAMNCTKSDGSPRWSSETVLNYRWRAADARKVQLVRK